MKTSCITTIHVISIFYLSKQVLQRKGFISNIQQSQKYLQAVNVQQVEFSFVRLLQDVALLNCHQMLLQVTFNFIEALETVQFIQK